MQSISSYGFTVTFVQQESHSTLQSLYASSTGKSICHKVKLQLKTKKLAAQLKSTAPKDRLLNIN